MAISVYLTYGVALAIAAAIPGPGVIAIVARALGSGFRLTLPMIIGLSLGDVIYLSAAVFGLAFLAQTAGAVFLVLKYCGAAYLAWMAITFWRQGVTVETIESKRARGGWQGFWAGLLVTLGNPKTMIFYLALLPTLMDLAAVTAFDLLVLIALTFLVLLAVMAPYALLAGRARQMLQTPKALRTLNRGAAACLMGAAATIALRR